MNQKFLSIFLLRIIVIGMCLLLLANIPVDLYGQVGVDAREAIKKPSKSSTPSTKPAKVSKPPKKNSTSVKASRPNKSNYSHQWLSQIRTNPIVPGVGLGGIKVGDPVNKVISVMGQPTEAFSFGWYVLKYYNSRIKVMILANDATRLVESISLGDDNFNKDKFISSNFRGATIGTSKSQLRQLLGQPAYTSEHYCPSESLGKTNSIAFSYPGIRFEICEVNQLVHSIKIGTPGKL